MHRILSALLAVFLCVALVNTPAHADFVGKLELTPKGCEKKGKCKLKSDFGYVDPKGIGWFAKKGLVTDGASIPDWAQNIVGEPFTKEYVAAAVIHDYYCVKHVRKWQDTHKVFYHALKDSKVPDSIAKIMYAGVLMGGPRWRNTIPGVGCPVGKLCVSSKTKKIPAGTEVKEADDKSLKLVRKANYGDRFKADFEKLRLRIESGELNSLAEIEMAVETARPDPVFGSDVVFVGE